MSDTSPASGTSPASNIDSTEHTDHTEHSDDRTDDLTGTAAHGGHEVNDPQMPNSSAEESTADADADAIPSDVHADYANEAAEQALKSFQESPDYPHLAEFLTALRSGHLVVDVSGTSSKKKGPRIRTIRSTKGQLVLPLFTSMQQLRETVPAERRAEVRGAVVPAREALALISSDRFVAAEFNKSSASLVLLRKYVSLAAGDEDITAASLEAMR